MGLYIHICTHLMTKTGNRHRLPSNKTQEARGNSCAVQSLSVALEIKASSIEKGHLSTTAGPQSAKNHGGGYCGCPHLPHPEGCLARDGQGGEAVEAVGRVPAECGTRRDWRRNRWHWNCHQNAGKSDIINNLLLVLEVLLQNVINLGRVDGKVWLQERSG